MGLIVKDDGWRISDELWEKMAPLIPPGKPHPLGCHRRRIPDRNAMNGILFVLRTGCQWDALDATNICKHSAAHRRFQEWVQAGVFERFWLEGLLCYDQLEGIDWSWLSMDGAMTKAPLGGEKNRAQPNGSGQKGYQTQYRDRRPGHSFGQSGSWGQSQRSQVDQRDAPRHQRLAA
jgi:transposase